jgi:hypothetical protein
MYLVVKPVMDLMEYNKSIFNQYANYELDNSLKDSFTGYLFTGTGQGHNTIQNTGTSQVLHSDAITATWATCL